MTDDPEFEDAVFAAARFRDTANPFRICDWCFHPRISDDCQFGAKHHYQEYFA